ncbi:hypothetical protein [Streptomyces sp. NPDC004592]
MAYWEVKFPTRTADGRCAVHVFMYREVDFTCSSGAIEQALKDVGTERAIQHRSGAVAEVNRLRVIWHDELAALWRRPSSLSQEDLLYS